MISVIVSIVIVVTIVHVISLLLVVVVVVVVVVVAVVIVVVRAKTNVSKSALSKLLVCVLRKHLIVKWIYQLASLSERASEVHK